MRLQKILKLSIIFLTISNVVYAHEVEKLSTITITANKVEENLQDVPQSITVIGADEIEEKGIKTVEDVIAEIPNMTTTPDRGVKVNFRGLNASLFTANNPVVIYIDGIPSSHKFDFTAFLENIERIEVLRGPQGTLYGKDSIGGVINIITKNPTNEITGNIGLEYGSHNYKEGRFNISAPIVENKLFFNLNGNLTADDGWIKDKVAKEEEQKFGASFYYKITDRLLAKLALRKEKTEDYGFKGYGIVGNSSFDLFEREKAENVKFENPIVQKNNIDSQNFTIKYEADKYNFEAVTVHRKTDLDAVYDMDFTTGTIFDGSTMVNDANTDTYSQEFRVSNKSKDGVRWLAGLYLDTEENKKNAYGVDFVYSGFPMGNKNTISTVDSDTQAIFGQTMIPLNEQMELTLGSRYQKIKKEIDLKQTVTGMTPSFNAFDTKETWNVFLPKFALNYKINENFTSFMSISKGYMPGGFNILAQTSNKEGNVFKPQQSINYELGIKGVLDDIIFTASLFRMDIKDIHVYRTIGGEMFTDNADKGHSQGVEFDFRYFPTETLEISGAVGFVQAKYDSYNVGNNNFSGKNIETTPSHTANLGIAYYHPTGIYARTDIKNQGSMYFYDDLNKSFPKRDSITLVDLKVGYKFLNWDIYAYVKNLTDEKYINTYETNDSFSYATFGDPRFMGVGVKYTF